MVTADVSKYEAYIANAEAPSETETSESQQTITQPTPEQLEQEYQRLYNAQPTFSETFLRAWATALLLKQDSFENDGKTYYCYK